MGRTVQLRLPWWTKVRTAQISKQERDLFERWGIATLSQAATISQPYMAEDFKQWVAPMQTHSRQKVIDWLTEMRDKAGLREDRLETLEWAILIFVGLEVIYDFGPLLRDAIQSLSVLI